jgi:hypothetical protein
MGRRAATMRATRIATRRDHKQEASFPQAVFLFPEMDKKYRGSFWIANSMRLLYKAPSLRAMTKVFRDDKRNFRDRPTRDK